MNAVLDAQIMRVGVSAREKDGHIRRACRLVLFREFDDRMADALKGKAKAVLRQLKDHDVSDATMKTDAIVARCTISVNGEQVTIPVLRGVRAKGREGKDEASPPTIRLFFDFDFDRNAWGFLGEHATASALITLEPVQQELASDDAPEEAEEPAKKTRGRRKAAAESEDNGASVEAH